ncbi:MAG TPA: phosphoribosyl-AMP cyclohydrolase [Tepidisphaeraceae bacterium]|jgi:phosphoribosyl-AMP cyclohydrolase
MSKELEEGSGIQLDFSRFKSAGGHGVMPVVVQDIDSGEVLLVGHASREALEHAMKNRVATFWSMSRNELWIKGATSGNTLELIDVRVNCEQNSLLYLVRLTKGGACHTKDADGQARSGCYYRRIKGDKLEMVK